MSTTGIRYYEVVVECKSADGEVAEFKYPSVWFDTDADDYGNGTYLRISYDKCYDLRYDTEYSQDEEISYLAKWADNYWSGDNGSWKLISFKATRKE